MLIKCAVIGMGYFGRFHAEKYAHLPDCELVAIADLRSEICKQAKEQYQIQTYNDYRELVGKIDAASITSTTSSHYEIAKYLLEHNIHLLIEKPIACEVSQAQELIDLAQQNNLVLQVGHIERFNPIIQLLQEQIQAPVFIEVDRLAPYSQRNQDTDVILDLMIHDLDLVLNFVQDQVKDIQATGIGIWSKIDIANARIVFQNGCVVNITESKFSQKSERKFRIFTKEKYFSIDLKDYSAVSYTLAQVKQAKHLPKKYHASNCDPLKTEINHFLDCVRYQKEPMVSGVQGKNALVLAKKIKQIIENDSNSYLSQ